MDGGAVRIDWDEASRHVTMTGPVAYVARGVLSEAMTALLEGVMAQRNAPRAKTFGCRLNIWDRKLCRTRQAVPV